MQVRQVVFVVARTNEAEVLAGWAINVVEAHLVQGVRGCGSLVAARETRPANLRVDQIVAGQRAGEDTSVGCR